MTWRSLNELATLREALLREQAAKEAERERLAKEARRAERERMQFALAVGPVQGLTDDQRSVHRPAPPEPLPIQRDKDERAALQATWSDEVDLDSLLLTDDGLSYRREGVSPDVVNQLRRGKWTLQAQIDLHGLRRDEAREALVAFIRQAKRDQHRCVRVVHGKGNGSPGREPVLKAKAQRWLAQSAEVLAFTQAPGPQGGAGALIVLLR